MHARGAMRPTEMQRVHAFMVYEMNKSNFRCTNSATHSFNTLETKCGCLSEAFSKLAIHLGNALKSENGKLVL